MSLENDGLGKLQIFYTEMSESDQNFAVELATNALKNQGENSSYHKDVAQVMKTELDNVKGYVIRYFIPFILFAIISKLFRSGTWNVIVGRSFGSFVTHETKTYV
jgi:hypothetical protein